jgi:hypothetical protein
MRADVALATQHDVAKAFMKRRKLPHKAPARAAKNGFRVESDHDDRVQSQTRWMEGPREAGVDSIMEIVTEPANNATEFKKIMKDVKTFVDDVNTQTQGLKKRSQAPLDAPYNVGPMDYKGFKRIKSPEHNWKGSIHVNIGIDPREYHSLIKWYTSSSYAKPRRGRVAGKTKQDKNTFQKVFAEVNTHATKAIDVGRAVAAHALQVGGVGGIALTPLEIQQAGNLRGLRGWLTHIAFYLVRGTANFAGMGGSAKNIAPVLLKSPPSLLVQYGLTAEEQNIFNRAGGVLVDEILKQVGRAGDAGKAQNTVPIFPNIPAMAGWTLDWITDPAGNQVPLTGGPLTDPTGVGPARALSPSPDIQGLPDVPMGKGYVGEGGRGGVVAEFRMIPGYFDGPAAWQELGLSFLKAATKRNRRSGIAP